MMLFWESSWAATVCGDALSLLGTTAGWLGGGACVMDRELWIVKYACDACD